MEKSLKNVAESMRRFMLHLRGFGTEKDVLLSQHAVFTPEYANMEGAFKESASFNSGLLVATPLKFHFFLNTTKEYKIIEAKGIETDWNTETLLEFIDKYGYKVFGQYRPQDVVGIYRNNTKIWPVFQQPKMVLVDPRTTYFPPQFIDASDLTITTLITIPGLVWTTYKTQEITIPHAEFQNILKGATGTINPSTIIQIKQKNTSVWPIIPILADYVNQNNTKDPFENINHFSAITTLINLDGVTFTLKNASEKTLGGAKTKHIRSSRKKRVASKFVKVMGTKKQVYEGVRGALYIKTGKDKFISLKSLKLTD